MKFTNYLLQAATLLSSQAFAETFIIDNDTPTALQFLLPLAAGKKVAGITTNIGDYLVEGATYEAAVALKHGNLTSCIPVYQGAATPLVRTNDTYQLWQQLYGPIYWQGCWAADYQDPNPKGEKYVYNDTVTATQWLIDYVKNANDSVTIVAAGTMTNLAMTLVQYPDFAKNVKLVIMGGYIDGQIAQATGGDFINDMYTDFNLMFDPEAAQTALSANWKELVVVGNISSELFPTQDLYDELIEKSGGLTKLSNTTELQYVKDTVGNGTLPSFNLPYWDEVAAAVAANPQLVEESYEAYVSIDTSFSSPFYGNMRIVPGDLRAKRGVATKKATFVTKINTDKFYDAIVNALVRDWTDYCKTGKTQNLAV